MELVSSVLGVVWLVLLEGGGMMMVPLVLFLRLDGGKWGLSILRAMKSMKMMTRLSSPVVIWRGTMYLKKRTYGISG